MERVTDPHHSNAYPDPAFHPDPHQCDKLDPHPHQSSKLDPDPHHFADDKPKRMEQEPILALFKV
jgi:hypothetical protein